MLISPAASGTYLEYLVNFMEQFRVARFAFHVSSFEFQVSSADSSPSASLRVGMTTENKHSLRVGMTTALVIWSAAARSRRKVFAFRIKCFLNSFSLFLCF